MSTAASRYAEYGSACPRCQQIISTIDLTFQQGIFIYDLTFIQQELESALVAALQRENELLQQDGNMLKLPSSSMVRLANGKSPRDFKAERERRRKALSGHGKRKRRMKKTSAQYLLKTIKCERKPNGFFSPKKDSSYAKMRSDSNGNSSRPIRSYRSMNFTFPYCYETNYRNGHQQNSTGSKLQPNTLSNPDQFWRKVIDNQHEFLKENDCNEIDKVFNMDRALFSDFDYDKDFDQYRETMSSTEYLLSKDKYIHPETEYSVVIKQNSHLYSLVESMTNNNQYKNGSTASNHRMKRKFSTMSNGSNSVQIDQSIFDLLRRDNHVFSSKYAELQHRLAECLSIERLALDRARKQCKMDTIRLDLSMIDDKILEITNSIRQRKRPSENAISLCKPISPLDNNSNQQQHSNGNSESDAWRKGRRQSTLRVYDELARLVDERIELEKHLIDTYPFV
ncbi:unnamed protein product [Adineta ricciae]|uniref:Uncharacterized protein n=2 Tax=Adineta ricciae TaxID=249248 RepID=A0A814HTR3_ADIRI|nr:unnamed protein product [Adineta ricciae]